MNIEVYYMNFLDKLERKFGRYCIPNLMLYIMIGNAIAYFCEVLFRIPILSWIFFHPSLIMKGQIWRIFTWIFIPLYDNPIWFLFFVLLYYSIGRELEYQWGSFKFNLYYLSGIIFSIIAYFIAKLFFPIPELYINIITATYINLSLFLAYAALFPNMKFLLYGIIPLKVKYLAALDLAYLIVDLIRGDVGTRLLIIVSLLNFALFFGSILIRGGRTYQTAAQKQFKKQKRELKQGDPIKVAFHKCCVCGKTEVSDPDAEFRYCSKCNGNYEYCMDHLHNHEHKQ